MSAIRRALLIRRAHRAACRELATAHAPALVAAQAMLVLNRHAKQRSWDEARVSEIYRLKSRLIRELYELGFPATVRIAEQQLRCFRCDGTGIWGYWRWDLADDCWKCNGTGIYRTHELLEFTIRIAGVVFVWHQPRAIAGSWYREAEPSTRVMYEGRSPDSARSLTDTEYERHCETVAAFLDRQGLQVDRARPHPAWREAVRTDLRTVRRWSACVAARLRRRVDSCVVTLRARLTPNFGAFDDDLPF